MPGSSSPMARVRLPATAPKPTGSGCRAGRRRPGRREAPLARMTSHDGGPDRDSGSSGLPVGDLLASGPVTIDLPVPAVVLAVGAHPDDIEFGCSATLAKW